tara:strand:- start:466 stop:720 length:255 start_codon:yes stop_codon:yes gene_type:complete
MAWEDIVKNSDWKIHGLPSVQRAESDHHNEMMKEQVIETVETYIEDLQKILVTLKQSKKMLNKDSKLMRTFYKEVKEHYDNQMF